MSTADGTVLGHAQIRGSAPPARAFNLVLLGDGFRASELAAFRAAAEDFATRLLATRPFDQLAAAINVFRIDVASVESGADDPAGAGGAGVAVRTYFDAAFGAAGLSRLLVVNNATVLLTAAARVPQFTVCLVIVNSMTYGGAGGSVGTFSLAPGAAEIGIHELGHTAFGLADEYDYWAGGAEPDRERHPAFEPPEPNVTTAAGRPALKWGWAVAASTQLPTLTNPDCRFQNTGPSPVPAGTVGTFEGARYYRCGSYRPEHDCLMRSLFRPLCRVCARAVAARIAPNLAMLVRAGVGPALARVGANLVVAGADEARRATATIESPGSLGGYGPWATIGEKVLADGAQIVLAERGGGVDAVTIADVGRVMVVRHDAAWGPWTTLGAQSARPAQRPGVVVHDGDLEIVIVGAAGRVRASRLSATGASGWAVVGAILLPAGSSVSAVAVGPDRTAVFAIGSDRRVWTSERTAAGWSAWAAVRLMKMRPGGRVAACAPAAGRVRLVAVASDGRVVSTALGAGAPAGPWSPLPSSLAAAAGSHPVAISTDRDSVDLFVVDQTLTVRHSRWTSSGWSAPAALPGVTGIRPSSLCALADAGGVTLAVADTKGHVWTARWSIEDPVPRWSRPIAV